MDEIVTLTFIYEVQVLESDLSNYTVIEKDKEEIYVLMKPMDLLVGTQKQDTQKHSAYTVYVASTTMLCMLKWQRFDQKKQLLRKVTNDEYAFSKRLEENVRDEIEDVLQLKQKIKGYEVYLVNANKRIWLSEYDWYYMHNYDCIVKNHIMSSVK